MSKTKFNPNPPISFRVVSPQTGVVIDQHFCILPNGVLACIHKHNIILEASKLLCVVSASIGSPDSKGMMIHAGDVGKNENGCLYIIKWSLEDLCYLASRIGCIHDEKVWSQLWLSGNDISQLEVIGNIWENKPEYRKYLEALEE